MDVAQKYGCQNAYGYQSNAIGATLDNCGDGRSLTTSKTGTFSAPLFNILSQAENFVPLGMMPNVRVQITLDSLSNLFTNTAGAGTYNPLNFVLSNVELCFTLIDFGENVMNICRNMGEKLYIKTQSFTATSNSIAAATSGMIE